AAHGQPRRAGRIAPPTPPARASRSLRPLPTDAAGRTRRALQRRPVRLFPHDARLSAARAPVMFAVSELRRALTDASFRKRGRARPLTFNFNTNIVQGVSS